MGDLLGGTTGQVLSKNSNTSMDFTWVTSDDANAIQNTIVDAKGDLIAASASDVPARLAVGANGTILTADSGEATGLKYAGNWVTFTPTAVNGFTLGNGSMNASYCRVGKVTFVWFKFVLGSTSAITGGVNFQIPAGAGVINGAALNGSVTYIDAGTASYFGSIETTVGGGTLYMRVTQVAGTWGNPSFDISATTPFTWGTADNFTGYLWYEVQ
jgi:hypothetical protein